MENRSDMDMNRKEKNSQDHDQVELLEQNQQVMEEEHEAPHEEEEFHEEANYTNCSKKDFVEIIESLLKDNNFKKIDHTLKQIKPFFDEIREKERTEALHKFVENGGSEDDFDFKNDELINRYDKAYQVLKERKNNFFNQAEKEKEKNLAVKTHLLDKLRHLVDSEETTDSNHTIKDIQKEWKTIGPVPNQHSRNLWASYHALLDRFYNNRSIYYELKELDRKKNLEAKLDLCDRAEKLVGKEPLTEAIKELNELHEEYKHIGPVYKDQQEKIWQRFKLASDKVYSRRKEYLEGRKKIEDVNLASKANLVERLKEFQDFNSDRINAWNDKTKQLLEIQKEWESIGPVPKENAKEINKKFWTAFKVFFHRKNSFFKDLESQRDSNLKKKAELCEKAEALKDDADLERTAKTLKDLQAEWKTIGPVPEKFRNQIFDRFKAACDHFFESKRSREKTENKDYDENYDRKVRICDSIEKIAESKPQSTDALEMFQEEWNSIGYVPIHKKSALEERFQSSIKKYLQNIEGLDEETKEQLKVSMEVSAMKNSPSGMKKVIKKEQTLRKRITEIENDIAVWKNNIEFFSNSKTASKLKDEFNQKIDEAVKELSHLKTQLTVLHNA